MKRYLSAALLIVLIGNIYLFGCGNTVDKNATVIGFEEPQYEWGLVTGETIVVWGDETDLTRTYMQRAFDRYELLTGNTLDIQGLSKEEMDQKVYLAFEIDSLEKPDILISGGGRDLDRYQPDQNFYDFTDAVWVDDLTQTSINQTIYNGNVIGFPHWEASISGTLYNKEIFDRYSLEIPKTQAEFMTVCKVLKENGITPVYLPYAEITMLLYQFPMDSIVKEGSVLSALNEGTLSYSQIPGMEKIVQWYKDMSDNGYFGEYYVDNDWGGMSEALKSEKYAMMLCWDTWLYSDFDGDASKFGLMPAFMGVPEEGCFEGPNLSMMIVNKNSPRLDAALDMISFMADPYNYNEAFKDLYMAPIYKNQVGSVSTPQYMEAERLIDEHFYDSTARLRIEGFAQIDASFIQRYMQDDSYTVRDCLRDMEDARRERASQGAQTR